MYMYFLKTHSFRGVFLVLTHFSLYIKRNVSVSAWSFIFRLLEEKRHHTRLLTKVHYKLYSLFTLIARVKEEREISSGDVSTLFSRSPYLPQGRKWICSSSARGNMENVRLNRSLIGSFHS